MKQIQKSLILLVGATLLSLLLIDVGVFGAEGKKAKLETVILASPGGRDTMSGVTNEMALKYGFYEKEGLKVDIVMMKGGIMNITLIGGGIDYASRGGSALLLAAVGRPVKLIFAQMTTRSTFLLSKPTIRTIKDLKGKTIGVGSIGDSEYINTKIVLAKYGLDPDKDVTFRGVGSVLKLPGLFSGSLDAGYGTIGDMLIAQSRGYKTLIKISDHTPPSIAQGLAVNIKKLREERPQAKRMVRANLRALLFVRDNREKVVDFFMKDHGLKRDVAEATYDSEIQYFTKNGIVGEELIKQYLESRKMEIEIREDIPISQTYDYSLLSEVIKELNLPQ